MAGPGGATADMRVTGIVLAGGRSARMGREKAALVVQGRTLLQRSVDALVAAGVTEVILVGAPGRPLPEVASAVPLRRTDDPVEGDGPLRGILAGLEAALSPVALVVGCDMPSLVPALLAQLASHARAGARLVVPVHQGLPQGLCSAWRRDAIEVVRLHLEAGDRAVMSVAEDLGALQLTQAAYRQLDPDGSSFVNVNTPADLAALEADAPIHPGDPPLR